MSGKKFLETSDPTYRGVYTQGALRIMHVLCMLQPLFPTNVRQAFGKIAIQKGKATCLHWPCSQQVSRSNVCALSTVPPAVILSSECQHNAQFPFLLLIFPELTPSANAGLIICTCNALEGMKVRSTVSLLRSTQQLGEEIKRGLTTRAQGRMS